MVVVDPSPATGVVVRKLVLTAVGVVLFAAGLTLMFESMRSVMDVGGYCASGGPYEIRQECPDGAWLIVVGIFAGLIGVGLVVAGTFRGGPTLWALAWPALFLALGWNFLVYGLDPPPPSTGLEWGWLVCAVVFLAMGGIPLLLCLANGRAVLWGRDRDAPRPAPAPVPASATRARVTVPPPVVPRAPSPATTRSTATAASADDDLVSDLERLAALHRSGALTDAEYRRAKAVRLEQEGA